jgi:hypothetical protein
MNDSDFWNESIGPFYAPTGVQRLLGITEEQLASLTADHDLLAVTTADGDSLYPSFQFGDARTSLPHLRESFQKLDLGSPNEWRIAWRLNHRSKEWGDRTAAELLRTDHAEEVLRQLPHPPVPLKQHAETPKHRLRGRMKREDR